MFGFMSQSRVARRTIHLAVQLGFYVRGLIPGGSKGGKERTAVDCNCIDRRSHFSSSWHLHSQPNSIFRFFFVLPHCVLFFSSTRDAGNMPRNNFFSLFLRTPQLPRTLRYFSAFTLIYYPNIKEINHVCARLHYSYGFEKLNRGK